MLECASPPIYVAVDGHAYGVYEVRPASELERIHQQQQQQQQQQQAASGAGAGSKRR
jgi:hypothetical protein